MKIAVLSGKGGTGKTFLAVNLAAAAESSAYIDCDVEEPNGRLFLKPKQLEEEPVFVNIPQFDPEKCSGCRRCVSFCHFNALVYIKDKPMVFPDVCHGCGGCALVCPEQAVTEINRPVGKIETGVHEQVRTVTGILNTGEASAVPVIRKALRTGISLADTVIIDGPPGSACSVMETVAAADYCVLAAEPTAFGLHNFKMVCELVRLLHKPCCAVINKETVPYMPLEDFCREQGIPVLLHIPFTEELARISAQAKLVSEENETYSLMFRNLLEQICKEAAK